MIFKDHQGFALAEAAKPEAARGVLTIAIVGRPNVGKSTLFNRLIGKRRAIVGDEPGITRDRLYGETDWHGRHLRVVDTGGIVPEDKEFIPAEIFRQARVALDEADAIVMVVDGRTELAAPDMELARLLQRTGKPLFLAVNKVDTLEQEAEVEEFRRLGIRKMLPVSAEHGDRRGGAAGRGIVAPKDQRSSARRRLEERRGNEPERSARPQRDQGRDHRAAERGQVHAAEPADGDGARHRLADCGHHARRGGRTGGARRPHATASSTPPASAARARPS